MAHEGLGHFPAAGPSCSGKVCFIMLKEVARSVLEAEVVADCADCRTFIHIFANLKLSLRNYACVLSFSREPQRTHHAFICLNAPRVFVMPDRKDKIVMSVLKVSVPHYA